jgi:outer membrane protein
MKWFLFVLPLIFALSGWTGAEDKRGTLPLERLVDTVLARNAGLRASQARVDEAEAGLRETRWRRLPMLSARSAFTRGDQPVYVFGSLMEQGRFGPNDFAINSLNHPNDLTNIQSSLDLGVPLFTGFELSSAARQSELAARQARHGQDQTAQQLRLQTAMAFLQLLQARAISKELDERLAASKEEIEDARRLKDRGVVLGSDYFAAQAIYGGLQTWKVQIQAEERTAQSRLEILTGQSDFNVPGLLTESTYTIPAEKAAQEQAFAQRPDLSAAASAVEQAEENSKQSGHSLLPRVDAFASLQTNTNDFSSNPSNHLYGVAARLPFGDPGYAARRLRAASGEAAARGAREAAEESARIDVDQAYRAYQATLESLAPVKETTESAAKSLQLFRPLYRSGRQSIIEVLRAEEGLAKARASYWQTLYQLHAGYLRLMAATGALDEKAIREAATRLEAKP